MQNDAVKQYVSELCDKYAHFGEFVCAELVEHGKSKRSVARGGCSSALALRIFQGRMGVGPVASAALGNTLDAPPDYYEKLYRLFKTEKDSRNKL